MPEVYTSNPVAKLSMAVARQGLLPESEGLLEDFLRVLEWSWRGWKAHASSPSFQDVGHVLLGHPDFVGADEASRQKAYARWREETLRIWHWACAREFARVHIDLTRDDGSFDSAPVEWSRLEEVLSDWRTSHPGGLFLVDGFTEEDKGYPWLIQRLAKWQTEGLRVVIGAGGHEELPTTGPNRSRLLSRLRHYALTSSAPPCGAGRLEGVALEMPAGG